MQKFTRDLKREIEIEGERLALTLSEKGISFRPVGSRKPATEMAWAAVIGAARGPSADPAAPAMPGLEGTLARLDAWLKAHRPAMHATLRPGASAVDLEQLGKALGQPVPDGLAAWLRWHNGQGEEVPCSLVGSFSLLSAAEIAEELAERQAGTDGPWQAGWIPLLSDFSGDLVCLDTTRPGLPVVETWRGRCDAEDAAPSLDAYLEHLLHDFEAGLYAEDEERGEFHRTG